jgi:hypothetical protein
MMHGMMMKMMERKVVATSDGGVVVVEGNQMTKYDRNLKMVKEVELPVMEKGEMKHKCSGCSMKEEAKEDTKKPEAANEHANHH